MAFAAVIFDADSARYGRAEQRLNYSLITPGLMLLNFFDVGGRDVTQGKPHPGILLLTAAKMTIPPDACGG